jgi:hypothetical protein
MELFGPKNDDDPDGSLAGLVTFGISWYQQDSVLPMILENTATSNAEDHLLYLMDQKITMET